MSLNLNVTLCEIHCVCIATAQPSRQLKLYSGASVLSMIRAPFSYSIWDTKMSMFISQASNDFIKCGS